MTEDSIVDEIHNIREQILAEYGGDLRALVKDAQKRTEAAVLAGHPVAAFSSRRVDPTTSEPTKKAG